MVFFDKKVIIPVLILIFVVVFCGTVSASETPVCTLSGDQVNPKVTGNIVAWEDWSHSKHEIYMKNLKTNKVQRITNNISARYAYFNENRDFNEAYYPDKLAYVSNGKLFVHDYDTDKTKFIRNIDLIEMGMYGNYIVYNSEKCTTINGKTSWSTSINLLNLVTNVNKVIYNAGSGRYNPSIFGNDIYWIDHGILKHYNIKTQKIINEIFNGRSLNSQLPGPGATLYDPSHYKNWGRAFSVSGNRLVYESYKNGQWDIYTKIVATYSGIPKASFTSYPSNPYTRQTITFDASPSSDPDGWIVSYNWNWGDGTVSTGKKATHQYTTTGYKKINLKVTDNSGFVRYINKIIKVNIVPGKDLLVTSIIGPLKATAGDSVDIKNTILNQGNTSTGSFKTSFYLVPTKSLSGTKYWLGSRDITSLAPNTPNTAITHLNIPSTISVGKYYIAVIVDSKNSVKEFFENNNVKYSLYPINDYVDLQVKVSDPDDAFQGQNIPVTYKIQNTGVSPANNITVNLYMTDYDGITYQYIGSNTIQLLAVGENIVKTVYFKIPSDAFGYYKLKAVVKSSRLNDINMTNNQDISYYFDVSYV